MSSARPARHVLKFPNQRAARIATTSIMSPSATNAELALITTMTKLSGKTIDPTASQKTATPDTGREGRCPAYGFVSWLDTGGKSYKAVAEPCAAHTPSVCRASSAFFAVAIPI